MLFEASNSFLAFFLSFFLLSSLLLALLFLLLTPLSILLLLVWCYNYYSWHIFLISNPLWCLSLSIDCFVSYMNMFQNLFYYVGLAWKYILLEWVYMHIIPLLLERRCLENMYVIYHISRYQHISNRSYDIHYPIRKAPTELILVFNI